MLTPNPALNLAPFSRWTLRDKPAQRRLALRWKVKGAEPVFEEAATKKRIKISEYTPGHIDIQAMFDNIDKPREVTFYSVMDGVFGKR